MNPKDQSRRRKFWPSDGRGRPVRWFVVLLGLLGLSGCESGSGFHERGDPLVGIHAAPRPVAPPSDLQADAPAGPSSPPLPAAYSAVGPAAVAAGETAVPEKGRDIRIKGDPFTSTSVPGNSAARGAAPGVTVGNPEPASTRPSPQRIPVPTGGRPSVQLSVGVTAPPAGSIAANIQSFDDAQQFLNQRGMNWQRLSMEEGEWKFSCGIPNPDNPKVNTTYQTSRPFRDPLSAIRAVIAEIEQKPSK